MAQDELRCPVCTADVPLAGDEKAGEEIFCTFCTAPLRLTTAPDAADCELEEDY